MLKRDTLAFRRIGPLYLSFACSYRAQYQVGNEARIETSNDLSLSQLNLVGQSQESDHEQSAFLPVHNGGRQPVLPNQRHMRLHFLHGSLLACEHFDSSLLFLKLYRPRCDLRTLALAPVPLLLANLDSPAERQVV